MASKSPLDKIFDLGFDSGVMHGLTIACSLSSEIAGKDGSAFDVYRAITSEIDKLRYEDEEE